MELEITRPQKVVAKTLSIHMKVRDTFCAQLKDDKGEVLYNQDHDYVPGFMPGDHYGDYLMLDIDIDTGQILNWKKPHAVDIQHWMEGYKE